jgi:high-affinity iron transporter
MLPAAIIIFREMFEIVLIVGIVLAATKNLPDRTKWIFGGFGLGLAGSAAIALFTDKISDFAEGLGQEYFNAIVLFTAAFLIGWTVLWMAKHGRGIKTHFNKVGQKIAEGNLPYFSLSLAIALAIWREGAEIVMFVYGMMASGQPASDIALGALTGGTAGLLVGLLVYFGLLKIPPKYFLRVTATILILLVAGMVSGGVKYLIAAGLLSGLSDVVWDSSWLLPEKSVVGQAFHALLGYTDQPMLAQLLAYVGTVGVLVGLVRRN